MANLLVSDTNIFIDLIKMGLIDALFRCGANIHTTAMVIDEVIDEGQKNKLLTFKQLHIRKYTEQDYVRLFEFWHEKKMTSNLSTTDCSVLLYARELDCPLITNDGKLRNVATKEGVMVIRLLRIIQLMVDCKAVEKEDAVNVLQMLIKTNSRAPVEEIKKMIKDLSMVE